MRKHEKRASLAALLCKRLLGPLCALADGSLHAELSLEDEERARQEDALAELVASERLATHN